MSDDLGLCNLLLCQVAIKVANDPTNMERQLEIGVATIHERCVSVVCCHPGVVSSDYNVRPRAMVMIISVVSE